MHQLSIYDAIAHAEKFPYVWAWGNTQKYPELGKRKGKPCAVLVRGSMNSALLELRRVARGHFKKWNKKEVLI